MRKSLLRSTAFVGPILLSLILSAPINAFGGWGVEVGRANEGDSARLLVDQLAMKMAHNRIVDANRRPLAKERQRQLLGKSDGNAPNAADLLEGVYKWWLHDVMGPAKAIAENPAASCAEAAVAMQSLLSMMHQRQVLGMSPAENDHSPEAEKTRAVEADFEEMYKSILTKGTQRCHEEALDECVATGRFEQIIQSDLAFKTTEALLPTGNVSEEWVDKALKQCAIYELHFVSTTNTETLKVETVRDGEIKLEFDVGKGGIYARLFGGETLGNLLKGETQGSFNPSLVSVKCGNPDWTCRPGATIIDAVSARILSMELQHPEFFVDQNGISKQRIVGKNKLSLELSGGAMTAQVVVKITKSQSMTIPFDVGMTGFFIAHNKDRQGQGPTVKFERDKRGVYPVIFEFTYADRDRTTGPKGVWASDSTVFELIHKPKPEPYTRPEEPTRKPLKPRGP